LLSFHTGDQKLIFHCIATPNIGGDIPIDVPTNQNIGGDTSPASPAGLTPMTVTEKKDRRQDLVAVVLDISH